MSDPWQWDGDDLLLHIYVQPKASRNEWAGEHDGAMKLRSMAPPVEGKANTHVARWLANEFGVARRDVELLAGARSRRKHFRIRAPRSLPAFMVRDSS